MSRSGGSPLRLEVMTPMLGTFKLIKHQSNVSGAGESGSSRCYHCYPGFPSLIGETEELASLYP